MTGTADEGIVPTDSSVLIEVFELHRGGGNTPVTRRLPKLVDLEEQAPAIEKALKQVSAVISAAAAASTKKPRGFQVEEIEASFSLTLAGEGALIVAKASAEATLSVKITAKRVAAG